ncbi:MAG: CPBP family intramembrane glutamic endopeptidase [Chthoniobacterales bacterium]
MNTDEPSAVIESESIANTISIPVALEPLRRIRWWVHLILIGGYFVPSILFSRANPHPVLSQTSAGLLTVCAMQMAVFGVMFGLGWWSSRATSEQMLLPWRPGWWVVPLGFAYSIAIRIAVFVLALGVSAILLATVFDQHQLAEFWRASQPNIRQVVSVSAARGNSIYAWLLITVVSFVVAGLREELWRTGTLAAMRALWPKAFGSRAGELGAILLIAIAFGAGHLRMGLMAAVVAGVLGVFLGVILVLHRSVWPAVIAHGCFDALSFALIAWLPTNLQPF